MHFGFNSPSDEPKKKPDEEKPEDGASGGPEATSPAQPADAHVRDPKIVSRASAWQEGRDVSGEMDGPAPARQAQLLDPRSDLAKRLRAFREEVNIDPKNMDLLWRYSDALVEGRQIEEAKGVYMRILKLDPGASLARSRLREICTPKGFQELKLPPPIVIFWRDYTGLIRYPFSGDGVYILGLGTAFGALFSLLLSLALALGPAAMMGTVVFSLVSMILWGYFLTYYFAVVKSTAGGAQDPPNWPEFSLSDCIFNVLRICFLGVYWFIPVILLAFIFGTILTFVPQIVGVLAVIGTAMTCAVVFVIWVPMAYLALAMYGNIGVLTDPRFVFSAIAKVLADYVIACFSLAAFWVASSALSAAFFFAVQLIVLFIWWGSPEKIWAISLVVTSFLSSFLSLYSMMVSSRLLGLLFRQGQARLDWFRVD